MMTSSLTTLSSQLLGLARRTACIHTRQKTCMYTACPTSACTRLKVKLRQCTHQLPSHTPSVSYSKKTSHSEGTVFDDDAFYREDILPYAEVTMVTNKTTEVRTPVSPTMESIPIDHNGIVQQKQSVVQSPKKLRAASKPSSSEQLTSRKLKKKKDSNCTTNKNDKAVPNTSMESGNKAHVDQTSPNDSELDTSGFDSLLMFPMFRAADPEAPTFQPVTEPSLPQKVVQSPPGVTTVLKETMSPENRFFLERWEKEMIEELGVRGFQKYKRDTFQRGTDLHLCIERYLTGKRGVDLLVAPTVEKFWQSIQDVLPEVSDVQFLEQSVKHPYLHYRGIVDCVAKYRGELCVIDWKTSKKKKNDLKYTFDNPIQLAAYIGAVNFDKTFPTPIEHCLLVIAYEDGTAGHAHLMTRDHCVQYWGEWLQRLHLYWCIKTSQLSAV